MKSEQKGLRKSSRSASRFDRAAFEISSDDPNVTGLAVFPTLVSVHRYAGDRKNLLKGIKKLRFTANAGHFISSDVEDSETFRQLMTFFKDALNKHVALMGYAIQDMRITQAWATRTDKGGSHNLHHHPNSFLSGIFYLDGEAGATIFYPLFFPL